MQVTSEDHAKLQTKQLANIIRKLNSGKTLTAREEAILAQARSQGEGEGQTTGDAPASGYAKTWEQLADACNVDRRTLTNARANFGKQCPKDKADGRKEIARWIAFLDEKGIRGRGVNNPESDFIDERKLRLQTQQHQLEKAKFELKEAKSQTVPLAHVEAALGHMLAKFRQALDALPGRIAGGIDEADQAELLKLLTRAEKQKISFKKLRGLIESGKARPFADIHARREFVTSEIDAVRRLLVKCEYLEADPHADEED